MKEGRKRKTRQDVFSTAGKNKNTLRLIPPTMGIRWGSASGTEPEGLREGPRGHFTS